MKLTLVRLNMNKAYCCLIEFKNYFNFILRPSVSKFTVLKNSKL